MPPNHPNDHPMDPALLIFANKLVMTEGQHSRLAISQCPILTESIQLLWRQSQFNQLNVFVQQLLQELHTSSQPVIGKHWQSFLHTTALNVANKIYRDHHNYQDATFSLEDIQPICLALIGQPRDFFRRFQIRPSSSLELQRSYAFHKILYSAYDRIRLEVGDQDLGRSDLGVAVRSSPTRIKQALIAGGFDESTIETYANLPAYVSEYLRHNHQTVNQLTPSDFQRIAAEYFKINRNAELDVEATLQTIGKAVRRFNRPPVNSIEPLDREPHFSISATLHSPLPKPENTVEQQEIFLIVDRWLSSPAPSQQQLQILWLKYHAHLRQSSIKDGISITHLMSANQPSVCRKLRQVYIDIAKVILTTYSSETTDPQAILAEVIELLVDRIDDFSINQNNPTARNDLDLLIRQYKMLSIDHLDDHTQETAEDIRLLIEKYTAPLAHPENLHSQETLSSGLLQAICRILEILYS